VGSLERAIATFLVNAIWQAPLLAGVGWAGARILERAPAAYRHRLWVCALLLSFLVPVGSALKPGTPASPPRTARGKHADTSAVLFEEAALGAVAAKRLGLHGIAGILGLGRGGITIYFVFLLVQAIRLVVGWRRSATLAAQATEPPPAIAPLLEECAAAFGSRVPVLVSGQVGVPSTFGIATPVVILPARLVAHARAAELRGILAHELSHVARNDCAMNLFCELVALPLGFHPSVRFLKRRVGGAREAACDQAAAAFVGSRAYARTLLGVAKEACRAKPLAGALGALDNNSLEERMKKILETHNLIGRRAAVGLLAAGVLGLGLAARGASEVAVAFSVEAGPDDMKGHWTAKVARGPRMGQPAAELTIELTPRGPDVAFTLYRYDLRSDPQQPGKAESLPVVLHSVERGVLRFRTRITDFRLHAEDLPSVVEADWQFAILGKDEGELTALSHSKFDADRDQGQTVPPPPPPLVMTRTRTGSAPQR
jgi:Zn-dependent protease with chaperone function